MIKGKVIYTNNTNEFGVIIAGIIIDIILNSLAQNNKCCIAFSGGSTPQPVFIALANKSYHQALDWSKVHIYFIDERCVPADHKENNFLSCYNIWLQHYPEIKYHRIETWLGPKVSAEKYEKEIEFILNEKVEIAQFDLIFMGMGEDGHIASLFPEYNFNKSTSNYVENVYVQSKDMHRVTMTLPLLNNAKNRIIGVVGHKKRKIFMDLVNSDYKNYPVAKLLSSNASDTWVIN